MKRNILHRRINASSTLNQIVCFSHLRWDFVYQRPQHLLSRCALDCKVLFVEEPIYEEIDQPCWQLVERDNGVVVATPRLPQSTTPHEAIELQRRLLAQLFKELAIGEFAAWYYTPMALPFTRDLQPRVTIYDCMDELSAFQGAPVEITAMERQLFANADVVFTGGASLYEAKRKQHSNVYLFPSSIDALHFGKARSRTRVREPLDQQKIAHPRIGFFGVLDERLDRELLREAAALRPDWQFVMIGPVVKIRHEDLPQLPNIHYLGQKSYDDLPAYIAGWDLAMIPFANNESTRFISPTKTPEYLAAGKPVISTSIRDVVRTYGSTGLIHIADQPEEFVRAMDAALAQQSAEWLARVDHLLDQESWDKTWSRMWGLILSEIDMTVSDMKSVKSSAAELGGRLGLGVASV